MVLAMNLIAQNKLLNIPFRIPELNRKFRNHLIQYCFFSE
jgi:hypothetical protein